MLDCAAWTLTHSSVDAAELALALELVPPLGLVARRASREATVVVTEAEDPEDDVESVRADEPVWAGDDDVA